MRKFRADPCPAGGVDAWEVAASGATAAAAMCLRLDEAISLAVALIQATPGDGHTLARLDDYDGSVVLVDGYNETVRFPRERAAEIGLALIRAAKEQ